jgi:uncharacterized membrane protein YfcA
LGGSVTLLDAAAVLAAGLVAGTVNTIVGAGTLVTFPTLVALGLSPLVANVTNTVGLVSGGFSGAWGYRRELAGQRGRVVRLGGAALAGGLTGGLLLLALPEAAFAAIVPALLALGAALVALQPRIAARIAARAAEPKQHGGFGLLAGIYATSVYGGYFGAAQGVLHIAFLGIFLPEPLQTVNGLKNVLATLVNLTAAALFVLVADIDWAVAAVLAVGSALGGQVGATVGRRLPAVALRAVIVVVGLAVAVWLAVS